MPRILSFCLALHWTVLFALLAVRLAGTFDGSSVSTYGGFGGLLPGGPGLAMQGELAAVMAFGAALTSVLFLWMTVAVIFDRRGTTGDADDVARLAFAIATGLLTVALLAGMTLPLTGLLATVSLLLAALLVSYVAVHAERRSVSERAEPADAVEERAGLMALGAAHNSLLSRLSGRAGAEGRF